MHQLDAGPTLQPLLTSKSMKRICAQTRKQILIRTCLKYTIKVHHNDKGTASVHHQQPDTDKTTVRPNDHKVEGFFPIPEPHRQNTCYLSQPTLHQTNTARNPDIQSQQNFNTPTYQISSPHQTAKQQKHPPTDKQKPKHPAKPPLLFPELSTSKFDTSETNLIAQRQKIQTNLVMWQLILRTPRCTVHVITHTQ